MIDSLRMIYSKNIPTRLQVLNSAGRLKGSLNKNEPQIDGLIVLSEWSPKKHPIP